MVRAAQEAGMDGVGITDHCMLPECERLRDDRATLGHTLDQTYERRRREIETVRARPTSRSTTPSRWSTTPSPKTGSARFWMTLLSTT
jgi:histidinol-phosphatase (PHP family)